MGRFTESGDQIAARCYLSSILRGLGKARKLGSPLDSLITTPSSPSIILVTSAVDIVSISDFSLNKF